MTPFESCLLALKQPGPTDGLFKAVDKALAEVGGHKPVTESDWHKRVIGERRAWVGYNYDDVKWAFFDHELIRSLGCESAINVPVVYAGRVLGTMNLLDAAGHYRETDPVRIEPFAALLIGPFLDAIAADPG